MRIFDSHCHLHGEDPGSAAAILARAGAAGVRDLVCVGVDLVSSRQARELARRHPGIRASAGIHPNDLPPAAAAASAALAELEAVLGEGGWSAVGETGLDLYRDRVPLAIQRDAFARHLDLAHRFRLPVIIHCRHAGAATLELLRMLGRQVTGVMHCYSESPQQVEAFLALGLHVSFAGNLTYPRAEELRLAARQVPLDRLLVETDAPYLAPQAQRGHRNEPAFVRHTLGALAEVRGEEVEQTAERTWANANRLFGPAAT